MLKVKNWPFTFLNPAPEASPVLTLGISSKGQVRTKLPIVVALHLIKYEIFTECHVTGISRLELIIKYCSEGSITLFDLNWFKHPCLITMTRFLIISHLIFFCILQNCPKCKHVDRINIWFLMNTTLWSAQGSALSYNSQVTSRNHEYYLRNFKNVFWLHLVDYYQNITGPLTCHS